MFKILVAEDERDILDLITFTLQYGGYQVVSAANGIQAWERTRREKPDLALLDIRMPGISGYEVCRRLKESQETNHIPIVFLSAKGQESEIKAGYEKGAVDYILKPFAPDFLLTRLEKLLGGLPDGHLPTQTDN
jgi:DNA-binding response OmpR family regulator